MSNFNWILHNLFLKKVQKVILVNLRKGLLSIKSFCFLLCVDNRIVNVLLCNDRGTIRIYMRSSVNFRLHEERFLSKSIEIGGKLRSLVSF